VAPKSLSVMGRFKLADVVIMHFIIDILCDNYVITTFYSASSVKACIVYLLKLSYAMLITAMQQCCC